MFQQVGAYLEYPWNSMADGIHESADLIAHCEASGDAPVLPGSDEFNHGSHEAIGRQRAGLFQDTFFRRQIDDTADEQVRDVLTKLLCRLILEDPFVPVMNEHVLLFACLDREHGDVAGIHSEQSLILEGKEVFGQVLDRRGADFVYRAVRGGNMGVLKIAFAVRREKERA